MKRHELKANLIISGPIFPEPVQVMMTHDMGNLVKVIGKGLRTEKFYDPILDADQLDTITASPEKEPFDGIFQVLHSIRATHNHSVAFS